MAFLYMFFFIKCVRKIQALARWNEINVFTGRFQAMYKVYFLISFFLLLATLLGKGHKMSFASNVPIGFRTQ